MTTRRAWLLGSVGTLVWAGCGGAVSEPSNVDTAGSEVPLGPPPSYLPDGHRVFAKIDVARIRRSPIAPDVATAIEGLASWGELIRQTGLRVVEEVDAVAYGAAENRARRAVAVIRHNVTDAAIREHAVRMSVARSEPAQWTQVDGYDVCALPNITGEPHGLVLTGPGELVIAPVDDLPRIASVAREHARRREAAPNGIVEPTLTFAPSEVLTIATSDPLPPYAGIPELPPILRVNLMEDEPTHYLFFYVHGEHRTPEAATALEGWLRETVPMYAGHFLVRSAGLNRPLEAVQINRSGANLDLQTNVTPDEARRALAAIQLLRQLAAG